MKKLKLAILPGDGIGKDVMHAALPIFDLFQIPVDFLFGEIGWECWKKEGNPVPVGTWDIIKAADATLLGAITSKPEREAFEELSCKLNKSKFAYVSPVIQLRQELDLFVNVRPCFNVGVSDKKFRFCIVRENTEGLYAGFDFYPIPDSLRALIQKNPRWQGKAKNELSCSLRIQSDFGLERLFEYTFSYAIQHGFERVTFADKPNVLRKSGKFAREIFEKISAKYQGIQTDILNVDAVALWLVRRPEEFGVIVAENMFGDILSDLGAAMAGGLGFAPSANIGTKGCYFEPVHGSAPKLKSNSANPSAMFLTISLLLEHFGYQNEAKRIREAIKNVIKENIHLTYDLNGNSTTEDMAAAIIKRCNHPFKKKHISFLTTGNEIINGDVQDSNMRLFSKKINEAGGSIYQHIHVSDKKSEIQNALSYLLLKSDAVIVTGGLGPTSDDCTRFAVANTLKKDFILNKYAWKYIRERLKKFNIKVDATNKQQALFPIDGVLIPNKNGTALGCHMENEDKNIFMIPGPPKESLLMFNDFIIPTLKKLSFFVEKRLFKWLTLGLIESTIAPRIEKIASDYELETNYRWIYPYLEIKIITDNNDKNMLQCVDKIDKILSPYTISRNGSMAIGLLNQKLKDFNYEVCLYDGLTDGNFEKLIKKSVGRIIFVNIKTNSKKRKIFFTAESSKKIKSEREFYGTITFKCSGYFFNKCIFEHEMKIPNRGPEIIEFAKAYLAWKLYQFIVLCKETSRELD